MFIAYINLKRCFGGIDGGYFLRVTLGLVQLRQRLPEIVEDAENDLTMAARQIFSDLYEQLVELDTQVSAYGEKIQALHRSSEVSQILGRARYWPNHSHGAASLAWPWQSF
jgi:hypothetical protein